MRYISVWLWAALGGAVLQFVALGSNFYVIHGKGGDSTEDAWLGLPHASDLILASAVITVLAVTLAARGRSPLRGRNVGLVVALIALLATAQVVYRMFVPPFGCLTYNCGTTSQADVTILTGMWIALVGCGLALLGGLGHAFSAAARRTTAAPSLAPQQAGMTPWLGVGALGLVVAFVAPFTVFKAYNVAGFFGAKGSSKFGGWLSLPHTSSLVLALTIVGLLVVLSAARRRAPLSPAALGAAMGMLAFIVAARELFRISQPPFSSAGGASNVKVGAITTLPAFWVGFAAAVIATIAGIVQVVLYYRESVAEEESRSSPLTAGRVEAETAA